MSSEKPDYTRALSADVLGMIFDFVLAPPHKCRSDQIDGCEPTCCVICKRMLVLFLGSAQATRLRAVCQRWRGVFLGRVILRGLSTRPIPWCLYPTNCLRNELVRVRQRMESGRSRMALQVLPQAFVLFPVGDTEEVVLLRHVDTEEDEYATSTYEEDDDSSSF